MENKLQSYSHKLEVAYQELLKQNALEKHYKMNKATEEYHNIAAEIFANYKMKQATIQLEYEARIQQITFEFDKMFHRIEQKLSTTLSPEEQQQTLLLLPTVMHCKTENNSEEQMT